MVNKNFEYFNEKSTYDVVGNLIKEIEEECHVKALFGRIAGSKTQGLSSKASDNDFCFFCEKKEGYANPLYYGQIYKTADLLGEQVEFEIGYLLYDKVKNDVMERYNRNYINYPTNFYRSQKEKEEYSPSNLPKLMMHRKEYAFVMFQLLILGDTIWAASDMNEFDFNELYKMEKTIDILDTYFVRAYGNFKFFMNNEDKVLVRKYLYTFSQIFAMEWLLTRKTKPPVDFKTLENELLVDTEIRKILDEYFELNKNSFIYKSEYKEKANEFLNRYIANSLENLKQEIAKYSRTEVYEEIIKRTLPSKRPQIYDEKFHNWRSYK